MSSTTAATAVVQAASVGKTADSTAPGISAPRGYRVTVFATGANGNAKPDAIFVHGGSVFVAYQNDSTPTGGGHSVIVQYNAGGGVIRSLQVAGRVDGMRYNPYSHLVWFTVNEDANSALYTWKPSTGALTPYTFSAATHGGGYDDLAFVDGKAFIAASNPTLNSSNVNTAPAVVRVQLSGNLAQVTPVLAGNATVTDLASGSPATLNLTDPDSLTIDPHGDLVLIAQGDKQIVDIRNPGEGDQNAVVVNSNTELDDTVWSTDTDGMLFVADSGTNTIYKVRGPLTRGTVYTETPSDSSVSPGVVGTVAIPSGTVTPLLTGFSSPTGLIFVSDFDRDDRFQLDL